MSSTFFILFVVISLSLAPIFGHQMQKGRRKGAIEIAAEKYDYSEEQTEKIIRRWA